MKKIFIERKRNLLRIAIQDKGRLSECFVEEYSLDPQIGEIYKGRVKNIVPAINSIFVDIGLSKEGYMYLSNELKGKGIKKGDEILVEVVKEPLNNKGAKLTSKVSVSGKFMVITLGGSGISFSKRITDYKEINRLKDFITPLDGYELLLRTNSVNATKNQLEEEQKALIEKIDCIKRKLFYSLKFGKVYGENIILNKVLRDKVDDEAEIIVDNEDDYNQVMEYFKNNEDIKIFLFNENRGLFHYYDIEKEILKLRHNKVNLPCGGNIVIDKTEAMYVIDVNSGKNIKGRSFEKTILETNVEAANEIGRQIRLRNLSGIIVIDFIDVRNKLHKAIIMDELKKSLSPDKGNVRIFPFTELDLVQISRKRIGKSIYNYLDESCKRCKGQGEVLKISYIENLLENEIIKCNEENSINDFYIELDKNYQEEIEGNMFNFLRNIQGLDKEIYLNFVDGIEGYKIEPLIFNTQKENVKKFKVNAYEKYE